MFNSKKTEFSKRSKDDLSKRYWNDTGKDRAYGSYVFDLKLSKEFKNDGEIVLHLDGSSESSDPNDTKSAAAPIRRCQELFYKQSCFNKKLNVDFGKFDLWRTFAGNNFAGDVNSQFGSSYFARDRAIIGSRASCKGPALRLGYALFKKFDIDCAHFTTDIANLDEEGFNILQTTFKPSKDGNYRLYAWRLVDSSEPGRYDFGISADQAINRNFGLFLRSGSNHHISYDKYADNGAILKPVKTWSFGIQLKAAEWSTTGIAVGQLFHVAKLPNAVGQLFHVAKLPNYEKEKDGVETYRGV
ncbi:hypothetical protein AGMMS50233_04460 [Endomicrobiia bacterium]|nr:hypothetical protein AGMMS50233_04460 [Endomicrobiia bacterium]